MKDDTIARLANEWANAYDDHDRARKDLGEAHRKHNIAETALEEARVKLMKAVSTDPRVDQQPIVVRTWKDHAVIIDAKAGKATCALSVDKS